MKVTLTTLAAGPQGVARPGTVLDVPTEQADKMIKDRLARPHDKERDRQSSFGFQPAPANQNE